MGGVQSERGVRSRAVGSVRAPQRRSQAIEHLSREERRGAPTQARVTGALGASHTSLNSTVTEVN